MDNVRNSEGCGVGSSVRLDAQTLDSKALTPGLSSERSDPAQAQLAVLSAKETCSRLSWDINLFKSRQFDSYTDLLSSW